MGCAFNEEDNSHKLEECPLESGTGKRKIETDIPIQKFYREQWKSNIM